MGAGTALECLERIEAQHPGFLELCVDAEGRMQRFVRLYLNEEEIDPDGFAKLRVEDGDRLDVLAAVAGG